jgi:putative hydrolase of the HAD superfamily
VDVYDTLLRVDFAGHWGDLPARAGLSPQAWVEGYRKVSPLMGTGRLSTAEGYEQILRYNSIEPRPGLVGELADLDRELLLRYARLYPDSLEFLRALRSAGVKIAIVSNCSEDTRDLLESNGVAEAADILVLSCEVGALKPAPEIYRYALDHLGVPAARAVFVDDQPSYCAGAAELGITPVQIVRGEPASSTPGSPTPGSTAPASTVPASTVPASTVPVPDGPPPAPWRVVRELRGLEALF